MILYLDASALVKRYVAERGTREVAEAIAQADVVGTSPLSRAETAAALAKAVRVGALTQQEAASVLQVFRSEEAEIPFCVIMIPYSGIYMHPMGSTMPDETPSRTLSERESLLLSTLSADGNTVFSIEDARAALADREVDVGKLLHRLHRKRWIRRLERGTYMIVPLAAGPEAEWAEHEYLIAASLVEPYYLAYATALHYYGYSERRPDSLIIATTRRKNRVTIEGLTYRFVTLRPHKFFGFETISLLGEDIHMAEREKAIADGFDHPELAGGVLEPAKGVWFGSQELDWEKLVAYTLRLRNQVAARRLGFWMELLGLGDESLLSQLENGGGHSYARLEPSRPREGPRNARWRLVVNVPERELLEWREHR